MVVETGSQLVRKLLENVPDPAQAGLALALALGRLAAKAGLDVEALCEVVQLAHEASEEVELPLLTAESSTSGVSSGPTQSHQR